MSALPRYEHINPQEITDRGLSRCLDCGGIIVDRKEDKITHARFHSILSSHAWVIAILENSHISRKAHDRFDVVSRIKKKHFDSWSTDALMQVLKSMEEETEKES